MGPQPIHPPGGDDDADDDWSFDADDLKPALEEPAVSLTPEELEALQGLSAEDREAELERRRELQAQLDAEGRQRRQNVRVNVKYPITVRVAGFPDTPARTRDLSATGIGFATRLPLELEAQGTLTIHFPEWNFTKEFVVRFIKPILAGRQVGVQFSELTDDEHERVVKEVFAVQRSQLQQQRKQGR